VRDLTSRFRPQFKKHNWNLKTGGVTAKRGERIPGNLWAAAVELAKQHGVWPTARALHLDHSRLKRCVRNGEDDEKSSGFVELIPEGSVLCACIVEMEDGQGARMRVEMKGAAVDVTALSRTFWSERG